MGLFSSVASLDIEVKSSGAKKVTDDLEKLSRTGEKTQRSLKSLGAGILKFGAVGSAITGLASAIAGLGLASKALAATAEQERVVAQLEAVLKSTGEAAGLTKNQLLDMASALQSMTRFGDEAIIGAESILLTFTRIGKDVFPAALQSILNVSTAMGIDLKSAAIQVGKALNDPKEGMTALTRSGITFSQKQKDVIKALVDSGRAADAQVLILRELETQFGNSAVAAADTLGGAFDQLKNAAGDLLEGDSGTDGVRGVKEAIQNLTRILSSAETKAAFAGYVEAAIGAANATIKFFNVLALGSGLIEQSPVQKINQQLKEVEKELKATALQANANRQDGVAGFVSRIVNDSTQDLDEKQRALIILRNNLLEAKRNLEKAADKSIFDIKENPIQLPDVDVSGVKPKSKKSGVDKQARELERLLKDQAKSAADFRRELAGLRAELDGPLAEAENKYNERLKELIQTGKEGKVTATELADAQNLLGLQYAQQRDEIKQTLNPARQLIQQLEFEVSLIGLTNAEREKAITLRNLEVAATSQQADKIGELIAQIEAAKDDGKDAFKELTNAVEGFGRQATDTFVDFAFGAKASFSDLVNSILKDIARLLIKKNVIDPIFSVISDSLTGGGGFFSQLFGGKRANGGPVVPNKAFIVGETGPELFVPSTPGTVRNNVTGDTNMSVSITVNADGSSTSKGDSFELAKRLEASVKAMLINEKRPGGLLA